MTNGESRISREHLFIEIVKLLAERSTCTRAKVGALIARDNHIISTGYVGSEPGEAHCLDDGCIIGPHGGCIRTIHAEENCLRFAANANINTGNCTLYVTLSPCINCAKQLIGAGINKVYYIEQYRDTSGIDLLEDYGVEVIHWKEI